MENLFIKKDFEYIKIINGKWSLNGKTFAECNLSEQRTIEEKILNL